MRILGFLLTAFGLLWRHGDADAARDVRSVRPRAAQSPAPQRQWRRAARRTPVRLDRLACPRGRHVVEVHEGAVYVDGRRVSGPRPVHVVHPPTWRGDGGALAWVERDLGALRLQVLPDLRPGTPLLAFPIPPALANERVLWSGESKVVMGAHVLAPRAVASWSDS